MLTLMLSSDAAASSLILQGRKEFELFAGSAVSICAGTFQFSRFAQPLRFPPKRSPHTFRFAFVLPRMRPAPYLSPSSW